MYRCRFNSTEPDSQKVIIDALGVGVVVESSDDVGAPVG
jgi:hypothetical protein